MKNNLKPTKDLSVINIGIDLGTTNSEVAISINGTTEVVKNAQQDEYTPSVFGIDKAGNKVIGRKSYDKLFKSSSEDEFANNKAEVKRLMGTAERIHFSRLDAELAPEDVSAEILKSLKEDVIRKYPDFSTLAAVITVPAYFSSLQAEATKRAGQLAGFKHVVLLQEPIAAAMAYGFDNTENQNWLVYDLGGGTFDVALISSKDGILTVLGHSGDNFLGGKDFDLKLVDEVIKPAILEKFSFTDFDRSNNKYKSIFARLKAVAESAKIELSQYDKVTIEVEDIGADNDGNEVYVSFTLTRDQFEDLIRPLVVKTIDLAKRTLKESGVQSSSVSKIVLVGGPTQIPFVRKLLESEFNLVIDNSIDPLTVVARGACIFGLSQRVPQDLLMESHEKVESELNIELHYDSMTAEDEQTITGKIDALKDEDSDYFIQIQSDSGFYSSSKIKLRNGKFFDSVAIEKGKTNTYWLYLFDDAGNTVPLYPESFSVTHGLTVSGAPIPHEIGVIYAKKGFDSGFQFAEVCDAFFEKNSIPPLRETKTYKTVKKLIKGKDNQLPIKVYEGESSNSDNNDIITTLKIDGSKLPYDLPEATEVDLTISIDESRTVIVEVYIPSIELTLNARADSYAQNIDTANLNKELAVQKERLKKVERNIPDDEYSKLEDTIDSLETNVKNAGSDTDDKNKAERDLRELKSDLDKIENDKALPQLKEEFYKNLESARETSRGLQDESELMQVTEQLKTLESEGKKAIQADDKEMLVRVNEQINQIGFGALLKNPAVWVYWLNDIKNRKHELSNQSEGEYHISKAEAAVECDDVEELQRHVRSLLELLPESTKDEITQDMAGITK
jgi:molecular chaperone DnaK